MIVASGIELRAGARLLLADASFQVAEGDRIGLVGRNGAGKTTLAKVLSGTALPAAGTVRASGTVGYLPQDPRTGDLETLALDRILSARGLDELRDQMRLKNARVLVIGACSSVTLAGSAAHRGHAVPAKPAAPIPPQENLYRPGYAWTQTPKEPAYMAIQDQFHRDSSSSN